MTGVTVMLLLFRCLVTVRKAGCCKLQLARNQVVSMVQACFLITTLWYLIEGKVGISGGGLEKSPKHNKRVG